MSNTEVKSLVLLYIKTSRIGQCMLEKSEKAVSHKAEFYLKYC